MTAAEKIGPTPWAAAESGVGNELTARIVRYKLGLDCRPAGRSAEWYWAYRVHVGAESFDMGRAWLAEVRNAAACRAARIVEDWPGGKVFVRGPKGGLKPGAPR